MNKMEYKLEDFELYRPQLLQYAKNMTRIKSGAIWQYDVALAEDIVQDSYIKFHKMFIKNEFNIESQEHLKGILFKNIFRLSLNSKLNNKGVKYRSKEQKLDLNTIPEALQPYYQAGIISTIELKSIYQNIHSLKYKKDIDALLLAIEGYNILEISNLLNRTKKAVVSSLLRCRIELRKKLNISKFYCNANIHKRKN